MSSFVGPFTPVLDTLAAAVGVDKAWLLSKVEFRCRDDSRMSVEDGGFRWWPVSVEELSEATRWSPSKVKRIATELESEGWLVVDRDVKPSRYRVTDQVKMTPSEASGSGQNDPIYEVKMTPSEGSLLIVEEITTKKQVEDQFSRWWKLYPRKTNRGGARRSFQAAAAKVSFDELLSATEAFAAEWSGRRDEIQFCPYASTWLNQERWSDYVVDRSGRMMECERLVAEGKPVELGKLLGVRVPVPNFEGSAFEVQPRIKSWLADWWDSEGRKLVG